MRKLFPILLAVLLVAAFAVVNAEDAATPAEKMAWFDLEGCGFCKNLTTDGLVDHMEWSNHVIATGMMSITTVEPGWEEKFAGCMAKMEETGKKMEAGEQIPMCGFCTSYGSLYMTGKAKWENFETSAGHVSVTTATDPEIIAMIQQHAQTTIDEYAKMEAAEAEAKAHEGHDH